MKKFILFSVLSFFCICTNAQGGWEQVVGDGAGGGNGFGDLNNYGIYSMAVFGSYLYVGTRNGYDGCEVWRFQEVESIPTLSEWGLIIFITILLGTGVMILRKRRMA